MAQISSCRTVDPQITTYMQQESTNLHMIEKFVVTTIVLFATVFVLGGLKKRLAATWFKHVTSACYMSVPSLVSYTLGRMGDPANDAGTASMFRGIYGIWAVFLLFAFASFDNLAAFSLEEINGRSKLLFQFLNQFVYLVLLVYTLPSKSPIISIVLVFLVVCLKVVERIVALAHASGATLGIRDNLRKIINFANKDEDGKDYDQVQEVEADLSSMKGFKYLVGPKHTTTKDGNFVDGITLEKIWGCKGRLLSSEIGGGDPDGHLKDTCLSFALFWLLLAKIRGYSNLYAGTSSSMKAWKLVRDGLLVEENRAFRVIEVELGFLRDYFYSKYMFMYLNGFFWKLISLIGFPIMLWYFTQKAYDNLEYFNSSYAKSICVNPNINAKAFAILILVLYALEIIQLFMFLTSRWYKVILLCYYAKTRVGLFSRCLEGIIGFACRVLCCTSILLCKPWKRELDQYSLLESCTYFCIQNKCLEALSAFFGYSLPYSGKDKEASVPLSEDLKRAVVLSLRRNDSPKLSNGISSIRQNGVEEKLSWACNIKSDSETILVWHIATSICELNLKSQPRKVEGFNVASKLSKYCAYLLAFAPLLVSIPVAEAEVICDATIQEARALLKKSISPSDKCKKLLEMLTSDDKEAAGGERMGSTLQKGVKLGEELLSIAGDDKRWTILAEFWAEMILYLAPSNTNEMAHAEKLAQGGEFITHLWALLIHAGIVVHRNN